MALRCFDGASYLSTPAVGAVQTSGIVSVSIWVCLMGTGTDDTFFAKWAGGYEWVLGRQQAAGNVFAGIGNGSGGGLIFTGNEAITVGRWQQWGMISSASSPNGVTLYNNGAAVSFTGSAHAHAASADPVTIGNQGDAGAPCNAMLAHAAIWSVVLSDEEMRRLAKMSPLAVRRSALRAYWPLCGGSQTRNMVGLGSDLRRTGTATPQAVIDDQHSPHYDVFPQPMFVAREVGELGAAILPLQTPRLD